MLPLIRQLREPEDRAKKVLIFLAAVYAITVLTSPKWYPGFLPGAVFLTLAIVWAPVGLSWMKDNTKVPRVVIVACVTAIALIAAIWGRGEEVGYANKHYTRTTLFLQEGGPQDAFAFTRDLKDKRIALAGSGEIFFGQYGFYGVDRSNYVQYIGQKGPNGTYRLIDNCREFINTINAGDFDYIITSEYSQDSPTADYYYPVRGWIDGDPALKLVVSEDDITPQADYVYKVNGKIDPNRCAKLDKDKLYADRIEALKEEAEREDDAAAED